MGGERLGEAFERNQEMFWREVKQEKNKIVQDTNGQLLWNFMCRK